MAAIAGLMPARSSASQILASFFTLPKGSRLLRMEPEKITGSCMTEHDKLCRADYMVRHSIMHSIQLPHIGARECAPQQIAMHTITQPIALARQIMHVMIA